MTKSARFLPRLAAVLGLVFCMAFALVRTPAEAASPVLTLSPADAELSGTAKRSGAKIGNVGKNGGSVEGTASYSALDLPADGWYTLSVTYYSGSDDRYFLLFDVFFWLEAELPLVNEHHLQPFSTCITFVQRQIFALHPLPILAEEDAWNIRAALVILLEITLQLEGIELTVSKELRLLFQCDTINEVHISDKDSGIDQRNAHANHVDGLLYNFLLLGFKSPCNQAKQAKAYN